MSSWASHLTIIVLSAILLLMPVSVAGAVTPDPTAIVSTDPVIQPMWYNTSWMYTQLTFSGDDYAECSCIVQGLSGTTRITAVVMLERQLPDGSWYLVHAWRGVGVYGSLLVFNEVYGPVLSGYLYRLTINAAVTRNGVIEYVSASDLAYNY